MFFKKSVIAETTVLYLIETGKLGSIDSISQKRKLRLTEVK